MQVETPGKPSSCAVSFSVSGVGAPCVSAVGAGQCGGRPGRRRFKCGAVEPGSEDGAGSRLRELWIVASSTCPQVDVAVASWTEGS